MNSRTYRNLFWILLFLPFHNVSAQNDAEVSRIYTTDTVVWFGIDFSLFRLSNSKKIGTEEEVRPYIADWIIGYNTAFPNVKMASMLKRKKVWLDTTYTASAYKTLLPEHFIVTESHDVSDFDLEDYVKEIPTQRSGIGLIFILENLFKGESGPGDDVPSEVRGSFVWFDIDSREILEITPSIGTPATAYFNGSSGGGSTTASATFGKRKKSPEQRGFEGYWIQGMIDATSAFSLQYKDKIPKTQIQY